jgi:hypothetical protein
MDLGAILTKFIRLDTTFRIDKTGADWDGLEFELKRIPNVAEAKKPSQGLLAFCPTFPSHCTLS